MPDTINTPGPDPRPQARLDARRLTGSQSVLLQLLGAATLGIVMIYGVGFASMDTVHNAAHDSRHTVAFPCH